MTHKVKWQVSLSNGETFQEGRGMFEQIEGELSPWNKLLKYVEEVRAPITSLSLYTDDGRTFNLHSIGKNPKFASFDIGQKPYKLALERKFAADMAVEGGNAERESNFTTIAAWYSLEPIQKCIKLAIWVDEDNPDNCWSLLTFE